MPDIFGDIQQQLNEFWQGLDNGQKIKLVSVIVLCSLIIIAGIYLLAKPKYETLYGHLDTKDMSDATKALKELKIDYKISKDGYGLLVPSSQKDEAKFGLADANIPKNGATYADAVADKTKLGSTESDKMRLFVNYKEKEVARVLVENSDSITSAEVFFNIPENSSFLGEEKKSTASVKITPARDLTPNQVEGIARFVANSMPGLDPKYVEVVDNNMIVLKDFDDPTTPGVDKQYTLAQRVKKNKEKEIRDLLSNQSTEFDDVKVIANLTLDFDSESIDAKTVEPVVDGTGAIISKSTKQEELINGSTGGIPGTDSNSGTSSYPNTGVENGSSYKNTEDVSHYSWNEKMTKTTKALGQVDKDNSSIAVTLYYGRNIEQAPSQEIVTKVTNIVAKATGLSNDKISVESFKVAKTVPTKPSFNFLAEVQQYGPFILSAILVGLLAFALLSGPKRFKVKMPEVVNMSRSQNLDVEEIVLEEKSEVKKQIDKFIKQKPEAVANLLRNWLTEDWE